METAVLATLHITGKGPDGQVPLDPSGMILGRAANCHVVLDSPKISRRHARIFQDPFGRWIIEDLGSRNGIWVGEDRIGTQAMLPNQAVTLGPYSISLTEPPASEIEADPTSTSTSTLIEDGGAEPMVAGAVDAYDALSGVRMRQLNAIIDRLAELTSPSELYPELCRSLARTPETVAVVLRVATGTRPMEEGPKLMACHFGGTAPGTVAPDAENLHISRRVIDAVRSTGNAVMATSSRSSEQDFSLTIVDERTPRAVLCSPLGDMSDPMDVFYLDIPSGHATSEMLDFVRAVARQVGFARKSLLLSEAKAERRVLDRQLDLAREIQAKLTPTAIEHVKGAETALCYKPAMWVGGDYCDTWALDDGRLAFAIGDVSGKGLPAAMVMSNLQAALRTTITFCPKPAEAMGHIDRHLSDSMPERMFITMFLGVFSPADGKLEYVNAGHILPIFIGADGSARQLGKPTNPPVGVFVGTFESNVEIIQPGEGIVVVTDGITEVMSPEGEELGPDGLQKSLDGKTFSAAEGLVRLVEETAKRFRSDLPQQDDITVFALRNTGETAG